MIKDLEKELKETQLQLDKVIEQRNKLQKENEKQKEILNILRPHLKMVQDVNGLVGLEYDMSALIMKEKKLIKEWIEND